MNINLSIKINKLNGTIVFMPEIFKDIECNFDEYKFKFEYNNDFVVNIASSTLTEEKLEDVFWDFYDYLGIILGYFPNIISATTIEENKLVNIVEQYKTKDCFIRESEQYINKMTEEQFKKSFSEFLKIKEKASFQLAMFNIAMMKSNHYLEIAIINTLQSLDGLFEVLYSNKDSKKKINILKIKRIYDTLSLMNLDNLTNEEIEKIKNNMKKMEEITFIDKLYYFCNTNQYDIFKREKELKKDNKYYFDNLLSMFVNTRNKFSHVIDKNNVLNGTESAVYIFKIIMLYRILIFEKIGIIDSIDEEIFSKNLDEWNKYIVETLK